MSLSRIAILALSLLLGATASRAEPITWTSWSPDLFERAKAEKRLVILDLEAVWCHWCHVMEAKTYGDERVRALIGKSFIAVRADQDANPDLSTRYGPWGWPATIVFAPDGTEIAKLSGYVEADSFLRVLKVAVKDPRPGSSIEAAAAVKPADSHFLSKEMRRGLTRDYDESWDRRAGGWGGPLKYIDADSLDLAVSLAEDGDGRAATRARETLDRALALIDPVWGGVYQYSDSAIWRSPHYEKIMSFQAQYLRQYSHAHARWQDPRYRDAARAIKGYLTGFLLGPDGAFYVSQNADLDHAVDGRAYYALDDAQRRTKGMPRIDTNLYARENGWAVSALAAYGSAFDDPEAIETAERAADWVKRNRALDGGGFRHGANDRGGPFLGDSIAMGQAFLDLYAATGERGWLADAERTAAFIAATFKAEGGGFASAAKGETATGPLANAAVTVEDQIPTVRFLNLLGQYTGNAEQRALAEHGMRYLVGAARVAEMAMPGVLLADRELAEAATHLTIVGHKDDDAAKTLFAMARALPASAKRLEWWDLREGKLPNPDVEYPDLGEAAAFACNGHLCSAPTFTAAELRDAVAKMATVRAPTNRDRTER